MEKSTRDRRLSAVAWAFGGVTVVASIYGGAAAAATSLTVMAGLAWWLGRRREAPSAGDTKREAPVLHAAPSRLASNSSR